MRPEIWAGLAALLLGVAAMADGLAMAKARGRWDSVATGVRGASAVALAVALSLAAAAQGEWTPFDPWQVVLDLVLAMLAIHLVLAWRLRISGTGLIVDLVGLVLIVAGVIGIPSGASVLAFQRGAPLWAQWVLFFLGGGGVLAAGSAGLMLALCAGLEGRNRDLRLPSRTDLHDLLSQAVFLALVALGSGLAVGVWWAWQTVGMLTAGDPRQGWMAVAWLVTSMSLWAWQLEGRRERWAAGFAMAAAATVLFGLLGSVEMERLLGL